jgi:NADPH:quinone reductase-like Zn-dependent oxidoreductase
MKAVVHHRYGPPDVLKVEEVDSPVAGHNQVLVRVHACSVNPLDYVNLTGLPLARIGSGIRRPRSGRLGVDFAGTVEGVSGVTQVKPGDEVFGVRSGALAEYVCVRDTIALKPANLTFEQAAAVPVAALTTLQALRDKGRIRTGQTVLINGASGGVGTFAVQIAKWYGAEVTGVCGTKNADLVRSLGADQVIDYTREDFTRSRQRYDVMIDIAGNRSWSECRRVLADDAMLVLMGGPKTNRWVGPFGHVARTWVVSLRASQTVVFFLGKANREDLETLRELLEAGELTPVIDRRYELLDVAEALRYLGEGHARAKIVISL